MKLSKIKKLRMEKGIGQWEMAREIGISESELSKIENGRRRPKRKTVGRIAAYLKCDRSEVVEHFLTFAGGSNERR